MPSNTTQAPSLVRFTLGGFIAGVLNLAIAKDVTIVETRRNGSGTQVTVDATPAAVAAFVDDLTDKLTWGPKEFSGDQRRAIKRGLETIAAASAKRAEELAASLAAAAVIPFRCGACDHVGTCESGMTNVPRCPECGWEQPADYETPETEEEANYETARYENSRQWWDGKTAGEREVDAHLDDDEQSYAVKNAKLSLDAAEASLARALAADPKARNIPALKATATRYRRAYQALTAPAAEAPKAIQAA
jgi:hypothetical protein